LRTACLRGSDDCDTDDQQVGSPVSIHAPARERPGIVRQVRRRGRFRSTPPRGSDALRPGRRASAGRFDPRPREGATHAHRLRRPAAGVSIHAPARERRLLPATPPQPVMFRSTPPRGSDVTHYLHDAVVTLFRSTPPRGSDDEQAGCLSYRIGFRSTPPRGSDSRLVAGGRPGRCFDPRPREGATRRSRAAAR